MSGTASQAHDREPALRRLASLADLDEAAIAALTDELTRAQLVRRGHNLFVEGQAITRRMMILDGWAARIRLFEDGRLQILSFLLPGDLVGNCSHERAVSVSTAVALTDVRCCPAPPPRLSPALAEAYSVSRALDEAYLLAQIARLGQLSAEERLADLLLELAERLELCGLVDHGRFEMPLTQQVLADATGLTVVHVNRMVRALRRQNDIAWTDGSLTLKNPASLARKVGRTTICVKI